MASLVGWSGASPSGRLLMMVVKPSALRIATSAGLICGDTVTCSLIRFSSMTVSCSLDRGLLLRALYPRAPRAIGIAGAPTGRRPRQFMPPSVRLRGGALSCDGEGREGSGKLSSEGRAGRGVDGRVTD